MKDTTNESNVANTQGLVAATNDGEAAPQPVNLEMHAVQVNGIRPNGIRPNGIRANGAEANGRFSNGRFSNGRFTNGRFSNGSEATGEITDDEAELLADESSADFDPSAMSVTEIELPGGMTFRADDQS